MTPTNNACIKLRKIFMTFDNGQEPVSNRKKGFLFKLKRELSRVKRRAPFRIAKFLLATGQSGRLFNYHFARVHQCISQREYVTEGFSNIEVTSESYTFAPVEVITNGEYQRFEKPENTVQLPGTYISDIANCTCYGGTEAVLTESGELIYDELAGQIRNYRPKVADVVNYRGTKKSAAIIRSAHEPIFLDRAVHLLQDYSENYYHWLTEVIPRALMFANLEGVSVLVSDSLHENLLSALKAIHPESNFIPVKRGQAVHVKSLLLPSVITCSHDNEDTDVAASDFVLNPHSLIEIRNFYWEKFSLRKALDTSRNFFIPRYSRYRQLTNQQSLADELVQKNFEVLSPENLTFEQQVRSFYSASTVIAPTGAALANIIFCRPGTKIIVLANNSCLRNHYIFGQLGQALDLALTYVEGPSIRDRVHSGYSVDIGHINRALM